jgi:hypothetical protein
MTESADLLNEGNGDIITPTNVSGSENSEDGQTTE